MDFRKTQALEIYLNKNSIILAPPFPKRWKKVENIIFVMYIMALIVGHNGPSSYANTIANRTPQSGGSLGGNKKAGIWGGNVYMSVYNVGNAYSRRAPQSTPNAFKMALLTTRNPTQFKRNGYYSSHSGTLG